MPNSRTQPIQAFVGLTVGFLGALVLLEVGALAAPILRFQNLGFVLSLPFVAVVSFRWSLRRSSFLTPLGWLAAFGLSAAMWFALFGADHLLFDARLSFSEALNAWAKKPIWRQPGTVTNTVVPCVVLYGWFATGGLLLLADRPHCSRCGRFEAVDPFRLIQLGHVPPPYRTPAGVHIHEADERARQLLHEIASAFPGSDMNRAFERYEARSRPAALYELQMLTCPGCGQRSMRVCRLVEQSPRWKTARHAVAVERIDERA